jgi:hypothetical protein
MSQSPTLDTPRPEAPVAEAPYLTPAERQVIASMRLLQSKKKWCKIELELDGDAWLLYEFTSGIGNPRRLRNR